MSQTPLTDAKKHEVDYRLDWIGDPSVPGGTMTWVTYYCKV